MAINKVLYGNTVLMDLTNDTVVADKVVSGYTAHDKSGASITGTLVIQNYYTGSSAPSSNLGNNGDIYFQNTGA